MRDLSFQFLRSASLVLTVAVGSALAAEGTGPVPYRILYSNDTTNIANCPSPFKPKEGPFREKDLIASVDETAHIGVDVHMLQPGLGWVPWWKSTVLPMSEHVAWLQSIGRNPNSFEKYILNGGDTVGVFVAECRKTGQVPFISFRVNDTHHVSRGMKVQDPVERVAAMREFQMFADHPDWRLGPGADDEERTQYAMDFGRKEVRDYKLRLIEEIGRNYDIGGLELDLMRHWRFFNAKLVPPAERVRIMTDFVRQVRVILDQTSKPGERRSLCLRVPGYVELHEYMGVDLRALAEAGVDMVNASGHYFTDLQMDIGKIREMLPKNVAVYTELHFTNAAIPAAGGQEKQYRRTSPQQFYTAAHLAYARGAAGVSTFNFQYYRGTRSPSDVPGEPAEPPFYIFQHLRDPQWLAQQPQQYVVGNLWNGPLKPGRPFRAPFAPDGKPETIKLDMAPPTGGWKQAGKLRIQGRASLGDSQWTAQINGVELKPVSDVTDPYPNPFSASLGTAEHYRAFEVDPRTLKDGINEIELAMVKGGAPASLFYLDISLP